MVGASIKEISGPISSNQRGNMVVTCAPNVHTRICCPDRSQKCFERGQRSGSATIKGARVTHITVVGEKRFIYEAFVTLLLCVCLLYITVPPAHFPVSRSTQLCVTRFLYGHPYKYRHRHSCTLQMPLRPADELTCFHARQLNMTRRKSLG